MLYCQQCGAGNTDDARFCNQCGGPIAQPGEPGGPLPESEANAAETRAEETTMRGHAEPAHRKIVAGTLEAPDDDAPDDDAPDDDAPDDDAEGAHDTPAPRHSATPSSGASQRAQSLDVSTISLSAIGVRSRGKAWGVLLGMVLGLVGLGALGMWVILVGAREPAPVAESDDVSLPDPEPAQTIEIGDPSPEGTEPAGEVVTGSPRPLSPHRTAGARTPRTSAREATPTATQRTSPQRQTTTTSVAQRTPAKTPAQTPPQRTPTGATQPTQAGSTQRAASGTTETQGAREPERASGGQGSAPDWESMEQEPDYEMEEYARRVRSVVRQYYARRAQGCFEHETRNERSVRGTVVIGFEILADGNIRNARAERVDARGVALDACVARQVGSWRLPQPPESPLAMQMPFSS